MSSTFLNAMDNPYTALKNYDHQHHQMIMSLVGKDNGKKHHLGSDLFGTSISLASSGMLAGGTIAVALATKNGFSVPLLASVSKGALIGAAIGGATGLVGSACLLAGIRNGFVAGMRESIDVVTSGEANGNTYVSRLNTERTASHSETAIAK